MDPRTRMILFKLLNKGVVCQVNGCISTGKEANVYHATSGSAFQTETGEPRHFAIKIYKTSILVFKDRDKYVSGEYRYEYSLNICFLFNFVDFVSVVQCHYQTIIVSTNSDDLLVFFSNNEPAILAVSLKNRP